MPNNFGCAHHECPLVECLAPSKPVRNRYGPIALCNYVDVTCIPHSTSRNSSEILTAFFRCNFRFGCYKSRACDALHTIPLLVSVCILHIEVTWKISKVPSLISMPRIAYNLPIINSKQQAHSSAAAIASFKSSFTRAECILRATIQRARVANMQQNPMNPVLIASAVFMASNAFAKGNILSFVRKCL